MKRVLAILVDALRYDHLSVNETPFLYRLSQEGFYAPLRPILGYSDAIRATIYTSTYPDENNYWMRYCYRPETSAFKDYARFSFLEHFPSTVRPWFKLALSKIMKRGAICNLPLRIAPLFDNTISQDFTSPGAFGGIPSIFDLLRNNGLRFAFIGSDQLGWLYFFFAHLASRKIIHAIENIHPETRFIFLYLHYLDNAGHRYGIESRRFHSELREVDMLVKHSVRKVQATLGDVELVVFSDHGMADARAFINFEELTKDKGFGKDYFFVTDSTMLRVWYQNEQRKDVVKSMIEAFGYGHFLSQEEKQALHLDFKHRYYGDDIYLVAPPYSIFPNSTSLLKPYSMHAYHPELDSQRGIAIFKGVEQDRARAADGYINLVDIMPTLLNLLGLNIPPTCRGVSLI